MNPAVHIRVGLISGILGVLAMVSVAAVAGGAAPPWARAGFVVPPAVFVSHTADRAFVGPGTWELKNGDVIMAAPWGRPPANFEELSRAFPLPPVYRSRDHGRTWSKEGAFKLEWKVSGMISDGGISFLRLADGRLALLAHRHLPDNKGGGLPVISFSSDEGGTWTPAQVIGREFAPDDAWYVMNDRLVQLRSGRLLVPVAHAVSRSRYEGDRDEASCFFSDNGGASWHGSHPVPLPDGARGMPEPCVAELRDGRVLMLARSGTGFLLAAHSADGGATWSAPVNTTLVSPCSSLTLKRLPDGRLIVFYDHARPYEAGGFFPRCPLVYAVSADEGGTWSAPTVVDDEGWNGGRPDRDLIYPSVCFLDEGMLVVYSSHFSTGAFSAKTPAQRLLGGGKRAILKYPAK